MDRRHFALAALSLGGCRPPHESRGTSVSGPPAPRPSSQADFAELERQVGGRLGVCAVDTGSGRELAHRADERFALCSTFKWILGAQVLAAAERGEVSLAAQIAFGPGDLLEHAPVTAPSVHRGALPVEVLARAAVVESDNTAANLLLEQLGGPPALTAFVRSAGDTLTRLDRNEPSLNENRAGDPRDTTTPRAMVQLTGRLLLGSALREASRSRLIGWLEACHTGSRRLRAGFPSEWRAGDKTGTGGRGAVADVAVAWPPQAPPILVACYASDSAASLDRLEQAHAEVARIVAATLHPAAT